MISEKKPATHQQQTSAIKLSLAGDFLLYSRLSAAKNLDDFKVRLLSAVEQVGFDEYAFAPVGVEGAGCLFSGPAEICEHYRRRGYRQYDLVQRHAETRTSPIYQSTIADYVANSPLYLESNDKYLELCEMLAGFGLLDTYHIPLVTPMGINCLFSVTRKNTGTPQLTELVESDKALLHLLADIVVNLATSRYANFFFGAKAFSRRSHHITPKQLQLLQKLAKDNVTLQGAADALFISLDTANKHIAGVKAALGARTQATAVYRAIVAGLIELDNSEWK